MHTKYRVSLEFTYLGPIESVPDSLFVSITYWLKRSETYLFCFVVVVVEHFIIAFFVSRSN